MDSYARPSRYRTVTRFAPPRRRAGRSYLTALLVLAGVCAVAANIFNKKPPAVSTVGSPISNFGQTALLGSYYDYIGRRVFVTARAKLGDLLGL